MELLLAVALVAVLLAAIAVATNASLTAYEENVESASLSQTARVMEARIRREIRTAESIDPAAQSNRLAYFQPGDANEYVYEYTSATRTLVFQRKKGTTTVSQTIFDAASPVKLDAFTVSRTVSSDANACTLHVRVQMLFSMDNQTFPAFCSAAVRRNQEY